MRRPGRVGLLVLVAILGACDAQPDAPARHEAALPRASTPSVSGGDVLYAASSVVTVLENGRAGATIPLRRTVSEIAFAPDGRRAFLATSDGVRVVDARTHRERSRLTETPARSVVVAQGKLFVLDHAVVTLPDGHAEPEAFHVKRFDLATLEPELDLVAGERILAIGVPGRSSTAVASEGAPILLVAEAGVLATLRLPGGAVEPLSTEEALGGRVRLGPVAAADGRTFYVPVEGPTPIVAEVDVVARTVRPIRLGRDAFLRGLALSRDGETLFVNALTRLGAIDLASSSRTVRWADAELAAPHQALALSPDGQRLYLARPIHDGSGSITVLDAATLEPRGSMATPGISPFTVAVRPP